jgi:flagellar hook-associated protein 1 FlgK
LQEQGKSLAESFNYISTSLTNIQGDIKKNLDNTADQVNSILNQLNDLAKACPPDLLYETLIFAIEDN